MNTIESIQIRNDIDFLEKLIETLSTEINTPDGTISNGVFVTVLEATINRIAIKPIDLAASFAVSTGTISRWRKGKNLPMPLARKAVFDLVVTAAKSRLEELNHWESPMEATA